MDEFGALNIEWSWVMMVMYPAKTWWSLLINIRMNLVVYHVDPIFNKKGGSKHHSGGDISNQAVVNDE